MKTIAVGLVALALISGLAFADTQISTSVVTEGQTTFNSVSNGLVTQVQNSGNLAFMQITTATKTVNGIIATGTGTYFASKTPVLGFIASSWNIFTAGVAIYK